jgi:thymidine phosphorylase
MVQIGLGHGVKTVAQLTPMSTPLGRAVGNALEVTESVDVLRGGGPGDVRELTLSLARLMLELVDLDVDPATKLDDGSAYATYREMIIAQGGDPDATLPVAAVREVIAAPRDGYVTRVDALDVGVAAWRLGAGRARKEDNVSAAAGVLCLVREHERVEAGQPLFELRADDQAHLALGLEAIAGAVSIDDEDAPTQASPVPKIVRD